MADRVEPERRASAAGRRRALRRPVRDAVGARREPGHRPRDWIADLRTVETAARDAEKAELADDRSPLHPMRVYAELKPLLDRDAIVVIDAGDFGSYAGRVIDSYVPGAWLDSGPFGCLGSGPGYALAAKLARPDRQVVLLQGDGAFGFSGMEWDTLVATTFRRVGDRQQRNLGAGEAPDGGVVRLFGGGRAAPRYPLRRGGHARSAGTVSWCRRPPSCGPRSSGHFRVAYPQWSTRSPTRRSPTRAGPISPDLAPRA